MIGEDLFQYTDSFETETSFAEYNLSLRCDKIIYTNVAQIFHRHWHTHFELLCFTDGRAVINCNNTTYEAGPGDILVFNCNDIHVGYSKTRHVEYYCLIIGRDFFGETNKDECSIKFLKPLFENKILINNYFKDEEIQKTIALIAKLIEDKCDGHELLVKSHCYTVLYHLFTRHRNTTTLPASYLKTVRNMDRIYQVMSYIRANHSQKISLDDIAAYTNTNKYHLSHIFKEYYNKTIWEYLMEVRADRAEKMLTSSDMSIKQIASLLGFEDPNYFGKMYKSLKGVAPSQVRKETKSKQKRQEEL